MSDDSRRRHIKHPGSGRRMWRLLAFAGLLIGIGSLYRGEGQGHKVSARGRPSTPPSAEALAFGFETQDISTRGVTMILGIMAATTMLVIGIVFVMVWRFDVSRRASFADLTSQETAEITPPAPHLQRDPFADLARDHARESRLLSAYGWIDADHTVARVPIARAMALSVGKSLDAPP